MIRSSVQVRLSAPKRSPQAANSCGLTPLRVLVILTISLGFIISQKPVRSYGSPPTIWSVGLDPGHGGKNYGAVDTRKTGRYEKHYTIQIARRVAKHLKEAGVKIWMSRDKDRPLSLQKRISSASAAGVDLFVSIHINDALMVGPRGHGTFFLTRGAFEESRLRVREFNEQYRGALLKRSVKERLESSQVKEVLLDLIHQRAQHEAVHLAHIVNQALSEVSPFGTRGVKQGNYGVIKGITTPAIVCEVGFMNHPKEGPFVTSESGMDALAAGIARGILRYLILRRSAELTIPTSLSSTEDLKTKK